MPCGRCNFCLSNKRADWSFRLFQEKKHAPSSHFLTLTYSEEHIPYGDDCYSLCKTDVQLFIKKLRQANGEKKLRYYTVGEYGTKTARPHYHSIMFGMSKDCESKLQDIWSKGFVHVGQVSDASIHYVTKYVINHTQKVHGRVPPFSLMSRRPGIGAHYLSTHKNYHHEARRYYSRQLGIYSRLPRFYKDKFFTKEERQGMAEDSEYESQVAYQQELLRLAAFHEDPISYYAERRIAEHDGIAKKLNSKNKF